MYKTIVQIHDIINVSYISAVRCPDNRMNEICEMNREDKRRNEEVNFSMKREQNMGNGWDM